MRILIAEAHPRLRRLLVAVLGKARHQGSSVATRRAAEALLLPILAWDAVVTNPHLARPVEGLAVAMRSEALAIPTLLLEGRSGSVIALLDWVAGMPTPVRDYPAG